MYASFAFMLHFFFIISIKLEGDPLTLSKVRITLSSDIFNIPFTDPYMKMLNKKGCIIR